MLASPTSSLKVISDQLAVSFIVDADPIYAYMGWHLAHSLVTHTDLKWQNIHVQCPPEVSQRTVEAFRRLGCVTHALTRFGDGRYCNKLAQWDNMHDVDAEHFVFLDTDMICVGDFIDELPFDAVAGKIVDLANPELPLLDDLFGRARFEDRPEIVPVDAIDEPTYRANCNGGFYSVPRKHAASLFRSWRTHALALLADIGPLQAAGKEMHVDQIAFCMAIHETGLPFAELASNVNYPLHQRGQCRSLKADQPLALLHYHSFLLNVLGLVEPGRDLSHSEAQAVEAANDQIKSNFDTETFWSFRYAHFPERGSGMGSRGENLSYKRELLRKEGIESAYSVLDVGCGDLEVVHTLGIKKYVGIDRSESSLALAMRLRPDWQFLVAPARDAAPAEFVLCFEVAIHQKTLNDYRELIQFLAAKTSRTLIVSGYDELTDAIVANHMLYFHEPLRASLEATQKFSTIEKIGSHSDVTIYRCSVVD